MLLERSLGYHQDVVNVDEYIRHSLEETAQLALEDVGGDVQSHWYLEVDVLSPR